MCQSGTPASCGDYACSGSACATSCTSDAQCNGNVAYCKAGVCVVKIASGAACGPADECAGGGPCGTNGFCCATACPDQGSTSCGTEGQCVSGTGVCMKYPIGTVCASGFCTGSTNSRYICDGIGNCAVDTSSCDPYTCDAALTACLASCAGDANCTSPATCGGNGTPNVCSIASDTPYWAELFSGIDNSQQPNANAVAVDTEGNAILVGDFLDDVSFCGNDLQTAGGLDIYVAKIDASGKCVWSQRFGDATNQWGNAVATDANNEIYLAGEIQGGVNFGCGTINASMFFNEAMVVKLTPAGKCVWNNAFATASGNSEASGVVVDASGNVYVVGYFSGDITFGGSCGATFPNGAQDSFLAKLDPTGACVWVKHWGAPSMNATAQVTASAIAVDGSGNVIVTGTYQNTTLNLGGTTFPSETQPNIFLVKVDPTGGHVYSAGFSSPAYEQATAVAVDGSGNAFLTGWFEGGTINFGSGPIVSVGYDGFLAKFGPTGTNAWTRHLTAGTTAAGSYANGVALVGQDVLISGLVAGSADFGAGVTAAQGAFLAKYDESNNYQNALWWAGGTQGLVAVDPTGSAYLFGTAAGSIYFLMGYLYVKGSAGSTNLFLARLAP
jgi:hypothetical protein